MALVALLSSIISGCEPTQYAPAEESVGRLTRPLETIPTIKYSPGNDMQGPDIAKARELCQRRYRTESSGRYKACVNMMLGKYHADDPRSFTFEGTLIEFADSDNLIMSAPVVHLLGTTYIDLERDARLEAIWGPDGAFCISKPRWGTFYYGNKPVAQRLPDCKVNRGSGPWIGQPFRDGGMLVSFVVNARTVPLYTYKNRKSGVLFTAATIPAYEFYDTDSIEIVDLAGFTYDQWTYKKQAYCGDGCPLEVEADNIALRTFRLLCTYDTGYFPHCTPPAAYSPHDYVTSSRGPSGDLEFDKGRYLVVGMMGSYIYKPDLAVIRPGMVKLITFYNERENKYFTTTERIARQVLKDSTSKEFALEGYIFENQPTVLRMP